MLSEMFSLFTILMAVILFTQLEKKEKFRWKDFWKLALVVGVIVLIGQPIMMFLKSKIHFTIPLFERMSESTRLLLGAIVFFGFTCVISIYGWKKFSQKNK